MKKLMKIYAKNVMNGKQINIINLRDDIAEEYFIDCLKEEHEKQFYDVADDEMLAIEDDDKYSQELTKRYNEILTKCIEYAKKYKKNDFGDYMLALVDENEKIKSPDRIGRYTFYEV